MTTKIIWKDIPGYVGTYMVSNEGNVYSYFSDKILSPGSSRGYKRVVLVKHGRKRNIPVHRLVMLTFHGSSRLHVNHIDGDKGNNNLDNLEYCTMSENNIHKFRVLGYEHPLKGKDPSYFKSSKEIVQLDIRSNKVIKVWGSINNAARTLKIESGDISRCCNGKRKQAGGFIWKFKNLLCH